MPRSTRLVLLCALASGAGACATTPPPVTAPPASPAEPAPPAPPEPGGEVEGETLGPLAPGLDARDVENVLGPPATRTAPIEEAATGDWTTTWSWPGIELVLASEDPAAHAKLRLIRVRAPSAYATRRGIRIGSTRSAVEAAYARSSDDDGQDRTRYLVGSPYGGLVFMFDAADRVELITMGQLAE